MRKIINLFLLIFIIQLACAGARSGLSDKAYAQGMVVDPNEWDFGRIEQGEVAKHVFVYKNDSGADLNIKGTNASCGCTASKVDKQKLAPGEEANLEVAFNSFGYSGEVQQYVYMNTDSRDNPVVKFTIKANVKKQ